jgi:hypothetical protein
MHTRAAEAQCMQRGRPHACRSPKTHRLSSNSDIDIDPSNGSDSDSSDSAPCPAAPRARSPVRPEQQQRAELRGQAPHTAAGINTEGKGKQPCSLQLSSPAQ